ncbi:unnamed protein product [Absidia cylindrospora]
MDNGDDRRIACHKPSGLYTDLDNESWCSVTGDISHAKDASALVFHAHDTDLKELPYTQRHPQQPWILETMESPFNPAFRRDVDK